MASRNKVGIECITSRKVDVKFLEIPRHCANVVIKVHETKVEFKPGVNAWEWFTQVNRAFRLPVMLKSGVEYYMEVEYYKDGENLEERPLLITRRHFRTGRIYMIFFTMFSRFCLYC